MLLLTFSLIAQPAAQASCSDLDPCGGWAILDTQGTITNIIVCQASVCGGGTFGGQTVVPQVASNPITNDTTARGGSWGTYDANTETFTVDRTGPESTSLIQSETDSNGVTVSVETPHPSYQFKYSDTIQSTYELDRSYEIPVSMPDNSTAKVSAITSYLDENEIDQEYKESYTFSKRETAEEVNVVLAREQMQLLLANINRIISKLNRWLK